MSTAPSDNLPGRQGKRRLRSQLGWYLVLACTVASCLGALVRASVPESAESLLLWFFFISASFGLSCVVIGYLTRVVVTRRLRVPELGPLLAPALVVAFTVAAWGADLPIAVRWQFSAHSFDDAARQVRDGVDPHTFEGHRRGLYRINSADRYAWGVYFRTSPRTGNCSSGGGGFARLTGASRASDAFHRLTGDWHRFCLDSAGELTVPDHPIGGWR
ncbi:hypothetical protein IU459_36630 [Nocardia amamiensis]|uniref:Uncharacterized protein n=1 Tax=Nocardia amamiensis TaxID=404578 RepID=A0ABS0D2C6_9NOCA|nr:hypothetical protein [Nocardia amamiensis]MBF6302993.1 hypothetical protein [Nocardia amamiensis]